MSDVITVFVAGLPAPQGSKRHVGNGIMVESSKKVKPWRQDVRNTLTDASGRPIGHFSKAVGLSLEFVMPRPSSTPKRKTPQAIKRPDIDKLMRSTLDAITSAGIWKDDCQVVTAFLTKRLAQIDEPTGCHISIREIE